MAQREETLNRRLGLLTILSAIFMPLTLLSGELNNMRIRSSPFTYHLLIIVSLLLYLLSKAFGE